MRSLALELRVALRRLAQRPMSTAVAVATLALGIGGCVAMFALTDALLLSPLRFPTASRLITLWDRSPEGKNNVGWATVVDWRARSRSLDGLAAMSLWMPTATGGEAELLEGMRVSDGFFQMLGVQPALGRFFTPQEDVRGNHHVAVLSYGLWQRRFAGDRAALGKLLHLDGADYTVVGVLPADFEPVFGTANRPLAEIFAPLAYNDSLGWACRTCRHLRTIGRLRAGVDLASARRELDALGMDIARANPGQYSTPGVEVIPLQEQLFGSRRPLLLGVLAAVGLVLLMATANIAGLRFAASLPRLAELAVRESLGAQRRHLVRLLLVESGLIALLGTIAGLWLARVAIHAAVALAPPGLERLALAGVEGRALLVAVGLAVCATLLFGALPALALTRLPAGVSRTVTGSRARSRVLGVLVAGDVALGVVLLAGAALFGQSLLHVLSQPPGFVPRGLLTVDFDVAGARAETVAATTEFYRLLSARVQALPGVQAIGVASQLPLSGSADGYGVHAEGRMNANPELDPGADRYAVLPGYFAAMGISLLEGRGLLESDGPTADKSVVVSAALAHRIWGEASPLGRRLKLGGLDGPWRSVVGVVADVRHESLEAPSPGALYLPMEQWGDPETTASLVIRVAGDPASIAPAVRHRVRELDPDVAVARIATMDELIAARTASRRFAAQLLSAFAALALILAALGVHGVVAQAVSARQRELGVRRALGSTDFGLVRLLLRQVLIVAGAGAVAGAVGAAFAGQLVRGQLYGVESTDPRLLSLVAVSLIVVAAVAALAPASRALRIDPAEVMREE